MTDVKTRSWLDENAYALGGFLTGGVVFLGCWIYAIATWGWFLGIAFGWIPAAIIGVIAGFLWPLLWLAGIGLIALLRNG